MATTRADRCSSALTYSLHKAGQPHRQAALPQWGERHVRAWYNAFKTPTAETSPGQNVALLYAALAAYADAHARAYESPLGDDGVLGAAWLRMLKGLRELLNGELGAMDGGTLDSLACALARAAGFDDNELDQ